MISLEFLEKLTRKQRQRALQISLGLGMVILVVLVELVAVESAGIYSFTSGGYKTFKIGAPKKRVLAEINRFKAIRAVSTCDPDSETVLKTTRHFTLTDALDTSDTWICRFRKGRVLLLLFRDNQLHRILLLKSRFNRDISSPLFDRCNPKALADIDGFLERQTDHAVFLH